MDHFIQIVIVTKILFLGILPLISPLNTAGQNLLDVRGNRILASAGDAELFDSAPDHYTMVVTE
jgi:hypothetical protein